MIPHDSDEDVWRPVEAGCLVGVVTVITAGWLTPEPYVKLLFCLLAAGLVCDVLPRIAPRVGQRFQAVWLGKSSLALLFYTLFCLAYPRSLLQPEVSAFLPLVAWKTADWMLLWVVHRICAAHWPRLHIGRHAH